MDIETGDVQLSSLLAVDDCGRVLDPMIVAGQVHGGVVQGAGQALCEFVHYDDHGQPLTATLMSYAIPDAGSVPSIETAGRVTPAPGNPLGVKGVGEAGTIGIPPAIVAAVRNALGDLGVTDVTLPLTPHRVWTAIRRARAG